MVQCLTDSNDKQFKVLATMVDSVPERALDEAMKQIYRYALDEWRVTRIAHEAELAVLKRKNIADERGGYRHMFLNVEDRVIWELTDVRYDPTAAGEEPPSELVAKVFDAVAEQM